MYDIYFEMHRMESVMRIPKHVGIIPDGNRRWAVDKGMEKKDGYVYGLEVGMHILKDLQKIIVRDHRNRWSLFPMPVFRRSKR